MVTLSSILPPVNVTTVSGTLAVTNGGTGVTTSTGTGSVVLSNSPTLVTPVLGAASATSVTAALGAVGTPSYTFTGDTNTGIYSPAADTIAFVEGGVEAMRIDSSANVGIGTSSPGVLLDVFSTAGPIIKNRSSTVNTTLRGFEIQTVNDIHASFKAEPSSGELRIASGFSTWGGYQTFYTNGSERMRITSAGDVGIGTTSPNSAGVNRAITVNGTSNSIVEVNYGGTRGAYLFSNASGTVLSSVQNLRLQLNTNDTPRVTIDSSGNVGVGTDTPAYKLHTQNSAANTDTFVGQSSTVGLFTQWRYNATTASAYGEISTYAGSNALYIQGQGGGANTIINAQSGKVGIGTTAPTDLLTVSNGSIASTVAGSGANIQMGRIAMYSTALGAAYTNYGGEIRSYSGAGIDVSDLRFYTANAAATAERMRIDSSGNLLVGGTTPLGKIHLQGDVNGNIDTWIRNDNAGSSSRAGLVLNASGNSWRMGMGSSANNGNALTWNVDIGGANTERMRIDTSGNVGFNVIPTTGGYGRGIQFNDASDGCVNTLWSQAINTDDRRMSLTNNAYNSGVGTWKYGKSSTSASMYEQTAGQHRFFTAPAGTGGATISFTQAMTLDPSGNLLVGTTTANAKTTIQQTGNAEGLRVSNSTASMSAVHQYSVLFGSGNKNTTAVHFGAYTTDANVFFVFGNGNVQNTNNSYGAISDIKLKENVVDATPKLDALMQVRVVNYNLKSQPDEKHIGVIAQELEEIFPGLVEEAPERDGSGELTSKTSKSVKYSVFVPMLIKALQEANGKIQELTARVAQLEGN